MCGINGIFGLENISSPQEVIRKMNSALAHRGPDADGVYSSGNIALGHRRLSILDLSPLGNQPFFSQDKKLAIVFNGEIYNFRELKAELRDFEFKTSTDTEVILAAYQKWGKDCVSHFNGMFAFAIYDHNIHELFIVRDRLGIKPLYFYQSENSFVFSSEIRGILASGLYKPRLKNSALADYLRYQTVHTPDTLLDEIEMLKPGNWIVLSDNEISSFEYWNAAKNVSSDSEGKSYQEVLVDIRQLLERSIERRLVSDVPFGAFLSGGIDSSAVVALMSKVSSVPVKTFNISFAEEDFSEAKFARIIAEKFKTVHTEIKLKPEDLLHHLPDALNAMDHPSGDGPNTWLVSKVTKEAGVTMALSGLGGDELFAGYDVFKRLHNLKSREWIQYFPIAIRKSAGGILRKLRKGVSSDKLDEFLRLQYFDIEHVYPVMRQVLRDKTISSLLSVKKLPVRSVENLLLQNIGSGTPGYNLHELSKISFAEMYSYMQDVLLRDTDQMSMAHALEVRVPFLDYKLVEYVMGVRNRYKFPHTPKKLLVDALGGLLPSEIVDRPKMGFTFPWEHWMKNELKAFCSEKMISLSQREWINEKELLKIWNGFLKGDPSFTWSRVWYLIVLENWLERNRL